MEPEESSPPAACGQGSHAHTDNNHNEPEPKLCKQTPAKRSACVFSMECRSYAPVKQVKRIWWSKSTVAVVTGGNRGLGLEIVRQLAKEGLTVVLCSRDPAKGEIAVNTLKGEKLEVASHQLDVTSQESVEALAAWVKKEFGGFDILINNAGVHFYSEKYEDAVETVETNYYGVKRVTNALLPLMRPAWAGARVINISTQAASLDRFHSCLKDKLCIVDVLTEKMVDDLATKFLEEVKAGKWKKGQWAENNFQFCESKLFLNTYTQIVARSLAFKQPQHHKIFVNAVCPGCMQGENAAYCVKKAYEAEQDMLHDVFRGCNTLSVEAGAETVTWLALLPRPSYPNGRLFSGKKEKIF